MCGGETFHKSDLSFWIAVCMGRLTLHYKGAEKGRNSAIQRTTSP